MGSLMIEENVVAEAGTVHHLSLTQIRRAIEELGYEARQRDILLSIGFTRAGKESDRSEPGMKLLQELVQLA